MGTIHRHNHYDVHRLRRSEKAELLRVPGLGSDLGEGLPTISVTDWVPKYRQWGRDRQGLEDRVPGIFTTECFLRLPYHAGRREGNVRELVFDRHDPFVSVTGMRWKKVMIKKFNKWAISDPEDQARTMYSLHRLLKFWIERGEVAMQIGVPEVITFKWPYLVLRSLTGKRYVREDRLPGDQQRLVRSELIRLNRRITASEQRLINRFKAAGYQYPSPDFIPSNIITEVDNAGGVEKIWIIDQFSVPKGSTGERKLQHGSMRRMAINSRIAPAL